MKRPPLNHVALLAVLGFALAACGESHPDGDPRALELAAGAASRSAAPVAAGRGGLEPGRYYTPLLEPPLSFEVGDGWQVDTAEGGQLSLTRPTPYADLLLLDPQAARALVRDPPLFDTGQAENPFEGSAGAQPFPEDYLAWLAARPELEVVVPEEPDTFAGFEGAAIEVVVANTPDDGDCFGTPGQCFSTYEIEGTTIGIAYEPGERFRVWDLEAPDGPLIAFATVPPSGGLADNEAVQSIQPL